MKQSKEDENEGKIPRRRKRTTLLATLTILATLLLLIATLGQSGVVKAEEEVVQEHGEMSAQLRPEFDDVSYVIDQEVKYKQPWIDRENWEFEDELNKTVTDGTLEMGALITDESLDKSWNHWVKVSSSDENINTTEDSMYYEFRVKAEDNYDEATLGILSDGETDGDMSARLSLCTYAKGHMFKYSNSSDNVGQGNLHEVDNFGFDGDEVDNNEYYRMGMEISDGEITASVYYDNYTEIDSVSVSDYEFTQEDVEALVLTQDSSPHDSTYGNKAWVDYVYVSEEGSAPDAQYTPEDSEFSTQDRWNPKDAEDRRLELDEDKQAFKGRTATEEANAAIGLNESEITSPEDVQYFNGTEAVHFSAQTEEVNRTYEHNTYWQGWSNLEDTIETNLMEFITEEHGVDKSRVEIIDYYVDDITVEQEYEDDMQDEIRKAYADALLNKAEEEDWELRGDFTDDEWETVDSLIMQMDNFAKMEIQGHTRYGHPELLQRWKDSYTVTQYSVMGAETGPNPMQNAFSLSESWEKFWDPITPSLAEGSFEINTELELGDITEHWADVMGEMKEMSVGQTALYEESVSDLADTYAGSVDDVSSYWAGQSENILKSFSATNAQLASVLDGQSEQLSDALEFSQAGSHELGMSLVNLQENIFDREEKLFEFFAQDADGEEFGRPGSTPLSLQTTNSYDIMTIIIIVVVITFIAIGVSYTWNNYKKRPGTVKTRR